MQKTKKMLALLMAAAMLVTVFAGCGSKAEESQTTKSAGEAEGGYTVTDMAGVEISFEKKPETVYIVGSVQPLVALYRYYAGNSDNLIECPEAALGIIKSSVFSSIWADMAGKKTHNDDANAEEILALNPDVVFMTGNATGDVYEALTNAGLKVVSFPTASAGDDTDTFATVKNWLHQMGEVFGDSAAADKLIEYNDKALADVQSKLADVKDEDKPNALIIFQLTNNSCKVAGKGHYSEFWLNNTGAKNAADKINKLQETDIEQLMAWDPDVIYLTTFSPATPEALYENKIEGFDFSSLKAVKNKQVYKIPLGSYRWYAPSCECSLMLKWMAKINQPELFKDVDMSKEVKDFFKEFYGTEPTDEQVEMLLQPAVDYER